VNACLVDGCAADVIPCAIKVTIKPTIDDGTSGGNSGPSLPGTGGDDDGGDSCATDFRKVPCPALDPVRESRRPAGVRRTSGIRSKSTNSRLARKRKTSKSLPEDNDKSDR